MALTLNGLSTMANYLRFGTTWRSLAIKAVVGVLLQVALCADSFGQTKYSWSGVAEYTWSSPGNWVLDGVPPYQRVFGEYGTGNTSTLVNNPYSMQKLVFAGGSNQQSFSITIGGSSFLQFVTNYGVSPTIEQNSSLSQTIGGSYPIYTYNTPFNFTGTGTGTINLNTSITGSSCPVNISGYSKVIFAGGSVGSVTGFNITNQGTLQGNTTSLGNSPVSNNSHASVGLIFDQNSVGTYGGTISGFGNMTKQGTGTLTLSAANGLSGITNINQGTLSLGENNALQNSTVNLNGGTLDLGATTTPLLGGLAGSGGLDLGSRTLTVGSNNSSTTYSGSLSGGGNLTKFGTGTLTLSGNNSYGGATNVNAGMLSLASANALPSSTNITTASGATLDLNVYSLTTSGLSGAGNVTFGTGTITLNNTSPTTLNVDITGSGNLVKSGTGDLTLSKSVNLGGSGSIRAQTGTIQYDGASIRGANLRGPGTHTITTGGAAFTSVTNYSGSTIQQNGTATFDNVTNRGTIDNNAVLTWQGGLSGSSGRLNVNGTTNVSEWSNDGVITINNGGTLNNSASNLTSGGGSRIYVGSVSTPGGQLNLQGGTNLDLQGSLLVNNGTITGTTNVQYGATAKGGGTFGAVNVYDGGQFSPGNSPGVVTTGATSWNAGGNYVFEINDATGTAGTNWDLWNITDTLSITAGTTPNTKFTIDLDSLAGVSSGPAQHFNNLQSYQWLIADAANGISGFDPTLFAVDASGFANDLGGGSFSVSQGSNNIYLNFTPVPEPSAIVLLGIGGISLLAWAWRRRQAA